MIQVCKKIVVIGLLLLYPLGSSQYLSAKRDSVWRITFCLVYGCWGFTFWNLILSCPLGIDSLHPRFVQRPATNPSGNEQHTELENICILCYHTTTGSYVGSCLPLILVGCSVAVVSLLHTGGGEIFPESRISSFGIPALHSHPHISILNCFFWYSVSVLKYSCMFQKVLFFFSK